MLEKCLVKKHCSGCSAVGSALGSGPRGRMFKSCHSDHLNKIKVRSNRPNLCFHLCRVAKKLLLINPKNKRKK